MELTCYLYPGWKPRIRAASSRREWMDSSPESYAYRCLPLAIANAHGWEILAPCGFEAIWNGGMAPQDVIIRPAPGSAAQDLPVPLFGQGVLTFHIAGLFRTEPGWNLWVGGPPNVAKDAIAPLSGLVETDWSPFTFTMNWRFTRPNQWIGFTENEPFCHVFPMQRTVIEAVEPRFMPIEHAPDLKGQFDTWSQSRNAFHQEMLRNTPAVPSEKWQKFYYRGVDASGTAGTDDHQTKLRLREFASHAPPAASRCPASSATRADAMNPLSPPRK